MSMRLLASRVAAPFMRGMSLRAPVAPVTRMLSSSAHRMNDSSSSTTVPFEEKPSSEQHGDKNSDASRADLWNQMLNTIIIDSPEKTSFKVDGTTVPQSRFGDSFPSNMNKRAGPQPLSGMLDQLDAEFRDRPTFGLPAPSTPTTGRSVAMSTSLNHTSAVLYRQLSRILSRNNVRRELKLNERYEKPNQMRRRKRSERHRRRFADMVRKKVQLVRIMPHLTIQIMTLKSRNA